MKAKWRWRKTKRTAKGSSSDWREIIPGGNLNLQAQKKSYRYGWYLGQHDSGWLLPYAIHRSLPPSPRYSCMCTSISSSGCISPRSASAFWLFSYSPTAAPIVLCVWCRKLGQRLKNHNIWIQSLQLLLTSRVFFSHLTSLCLSALIFKMGG